MGEWVLAVVGLAALAGLAGLSAGSLLRAGTTQTLIRRIREISGNPAWFSGDSLMNWSRLMRYEVFAAAREPAFANDEVVRRCLRRESVGLRLQLWGGLGFVVCIATLIALNPKPDPRSEAPASRRVR